MAVLCRQTAEGEPEQTYTIEPHSPEQTDDELLHLKAQGAEDKGWAVSWSSAVSFTATKVRWDDVLCTRQFWVE